MLCCASRSAYLLADCRSRPRGAPPNLYAAQLSSVIGSAVPLVAVNPLPNTTIALPPGW